MGEQADGFAEGGLKGSTVWVFVEAVGGEDLAQDEEGRHCSVVEFWLGLLLRIWGKRE